jgi:hypothetical protein
VYAQLVSAHVGERGAATSHLEAKNAALAAKIEVAAHNVADLDRRLNQVDVTIEEAAKRGRTNAALSAIEGQRKARAALADQRQHEGVTLANLKAERAALGAKGRQIETEAAPIRYVAELLGADTDAEKAIRWLTASPKTSATRTRRQTRAVARHRRASHPAVTSLADSMVAAMPMIASGVPGNKVTIPLTEKNAAAPARAIATV